MAEVRHVVVGSHEGQRLDNFLLSQLKGVPRSRVYRMIRSGEVRVNGRRAKPSARLTPEDKVRIPPVATKSVSDEPRPSKAWIEKLQASVVFENDEIFVLNKPVGVAVQGGTGEPFGIAETLSLVFNQEDLQLAHRLDKATSGCLVIVKHRAAMLEYHRWFRGRAIEKTYQLIVQGSWSRNLLSVDEPLERFKLANGERRVRVSPAGQASSTSFAIQDTCRRATWLTARPLTGRTHQIRVHTQFVKHPIVGDRKYGSRKFEPRAPRLMLHAQALTLPDIGTIETPIPDAFPQYWERLKAGD